MGEAIVNVKQIFAEEIKYEIHLVVITPVH